MKNTLLFILSIISAVLLGYVIFLKSPAGLKELSVKSSKEVEIKEISLGKADAPIEVAEYSSFDCKTCSDFHKNSFPKFKRDYIDSGKVKYVMKDFITNQNALFTAMLPKCAPAEKQFELAQAIYIDQSIWGQNVIPLKELRIIAGKFGINDADFYNCIENSKLAMNILTGQQDAFKKLGVITPPTFLINGEKLERFATIDDLTAAIEAKSAGRSINESFWKEASELLTHTPDDKFLGNFDAPVTIIEYASLSCPHCAKFHNEILPQVKKELIETGKVKFIFRNFPLNKAAIKGAILVECSGKEQYYSILGKLYGKQQYWAFNEAEIDSKLKEIASEENISAERFANCMANKELENNIVLKSHAAASKLGINSTPAFFINGKKVEHMHSFDEVKKAVDEAK
ncbi:MAG TPA: hypothetical protein DIV86_02295 [Alphaproteobacteria bacterium]|nr:hypothetical protein [Alphaproteobacteria bacterium]